VSALKDVKKRAMIKFTLVRKVIVEEIYEVVAETPIEAIALAEAGEGLNETFEVSTGSFRIENSEPGFSR
jgi:hypothetical protein